MRKSKGMRRMAKGGMKMMRASKGGTKMMKARGGRMASKGGTKMMGAMKGKMATKGYAKGGAGFAKPHNYFAGGSVTNNLKSK